MLGCDARVRAEVRAAKTSSPMAKISFFQTVPKTSSCPLQQRAPHHNQTLDYDARMREVTRMCAVALPYVRCACGNAYGKDFITDGEDIICSDCAKDKLMSTATASSTS